MPDLVSDVRINAMRLGGRVNAPQIIILLDAKALARIQPVSRPTVCGDANIA
jgi:hypothetical protein